MPSTDQILRQAAHDVEQIREINRILGGRPADVDRDLDPSPRAQTVAASAVAPGRVDWLWPGASPWAC